MTPAGKRPESRLLLKLLDEAFDKKAWHGTTLRGSLRGLAAGQAEWRPRPRSHNICEIAVHAAYWKYTVRRRLLGLKKGSFPLKGSNWFTHPGRLSERTWQNYVALLNEEHRLLREAVSRFDTAKLETRAPGTQSTYATLLCGIAAHDLYHAGQIQLLKRLQSR